eukprot:scaffold4824_cov145-Isochrysis_galbana.AAC.4
MQSETETQNNIDIALLLCFAHAYKYCMHSMMHDACVHIIYIYISFRSFSAERLPPRESAQDSRRETRDRDQVVIPRDSPYLSFALGLARVEDRVAAPPPGSAAPGLGCGRHECSGCAV